MNETSYTPINENNDCIPMLDQLFRLQPYIQARSFLQAQVIRLCHSLETFKSFVVEDDFSVTVR